MTDLEPGRPLSNGVEPTHPVTNKIVHTGSSAPSAGYVLNRDYAASTRLNCQFFLWKEELGFNLHPSVDIPQSGSRIADIATGTAIWLLDLARSFPNSRLDGFDISLEQCPPPDWLPGSVSLNQWDVFSPVPSALKGQYDMVHIRLALLVVRYNDPRPILRNVLELLKPGGYLQWDELNVFEANVASTNPATDTEKFQRAQELTDLSRLEWVRELRGIIEQSGFEQTQEFKYECNLTLAKYYQDMQFLVMEEEAANAPSAERKATVYGAINATYEESKKGIARCTPKIVVVARKSRRE
jgi:SAM-dependent methyltransferase